MRPAAGGADPVPPLFAGIDFSSAPTRRKPIVIARCRAVGAGVAAGFDAGLGRESTPEQAPEPAHVRQPEPDRSLHLALEGFDRLDTLAAFDRWLAADDASPARASTWVAGCDFPFGLPRDFLAAQGWDRDWAGSIAAVAALSRADLVDRCRAFCAARPMGARFAHRATDRPAGSSPSMKWVNPPVVLMLHAGATRLAAAGVDLPGLRRGDPSRVALEAYPGMLARELLGRRSYKNDDPRRDDAGRREARATLVSRLRRGDHRLAIPVTLDEAQVDALVAESSADSLDAVICAVQAAWGWQRRDRRYGLPDAIDPLEGWIVSAPSEP